jgi:hypothetical protein
VTYCVVAEPEELTSGSVLRLAKVTRDFPPNATVPQVFHFRPSSAEVRDAKVSSLPVRISVYDLQRTSPAQARAMLSSQELYLAFSIQVAAIRAIVVPGQRDRLAVFREIDPSDARPGADGHCGLLGVGDQPGDVHRLIRAKLCAIADLVE